MNISAYIAEIRNRFPDRDYLLVNDIAAYLSMKPKSLRSLRERGNFPIARKRGGRVGCTVMELAEYMMSCNATHGRGKPSPASSKPQFILKPPSGRESFAAMIAQARIQAEFISALADALEAISLRGQNEPFTRSEASL